MHWFFIALVGPALWSVTNHVDKYLLSKYLKNTGSGALIIFSALIGIFTLPGILIFQPQALNVSFPLAVLLISNGSIYVLALIPYFIALQKDEASIVVPLFQTIPLFSYILGLIFLRETLTASQLFASLLVICGAILISLDLTIHHRPKLKHSVFWLMFLSSFLVAINSLIFKFAAIQTNFWTSSFWEYVGFSLMAAILLICVTSYRNDFLSLIKTNKVPLLGLNGFNEIINLLAKFTFNYATLLAPLALVWVVNGFQPFFVFFYGLLLSVFFPHLGREDLSRNAVIQKLLAIAIMFFGTYVLQRA